MKLLSVAIAALTLLSTVLTTPTPSLKDRATAAVSNKVIFSPPTNARWVDPRVLYARAVSLKSGALLATWENYSPEPPLVYFPIWRSTDGGNTWQEIGRVTDQKNNWGLRYQPTLFELPIAIGKFPAGTLLLSGNSIPTNLSKTKIDVYASLDEGVTWTFVSSVASGGEARPNNGLTPIWEPLFMVYNNQLICYYSDQRDPKHGQKLIHTTTTDLLTWTTGVNDVTDANYAGRPGMTAVTKLPNGAYMFAYELCGTDGCRVHYRLPTDPLNALAARDYKLNPPVTSSPYVVWSSVGGANGTIVLSGGGSGQIWTNRKLGDPNSWVLYNTPQPAAYSRGLAFLTGDDSQLVIIGAGRLPPAGNNNQVSVSVVNLKTLMGV